MAVIPLVDDETIVDSKEAYEARGGLGGRVVFIQNIERTQLLSNNDANVTYDLRVGPEYRYLHNRAKNELREGDKIVLRRGESVLIQTEEAVHVPRTVFGVVLTKVSVVQRGASNDASKVDPGYNGQLIVTVTNFSKEPVVFERKKPFCSIFFLRMEDEAKLYDKPPKRIEGSNDRGDRRNLADTIEVYQVPIIITLIIATILNLIIEGIQFLF